MSRPYKIKKRPRYLVPKDKRCLRKECAEPVIDDTPLCAHHSYKKEPVLHEAAIARLPECHAKRVAMLKLRLEQRASRESERSKDMACLINALKQLREDLDEDY